MVDDAGQAGARNSYGGHGVFVPDSLRASWIVEIVEPSGHIYRIFADGRIEGFADDALAFNYVPSLLASGSISQASA
jgi:hypothetical protein